MFYKLEWQTPHETPHGLTVPERCLRAERCRHRLPLGVRDWMPELSVHLSALHDEPQIYFGPVNPDKMAVLAEIFSPLETAPPNRPDKDHFLKPCKGRRPPLFESREAFDAAGATPA